MRFFKKIDNLLLVIVSKSKLFYCRLVLKDQLKIGVNANLKNTSRINVWGNNGKISIQNNFSMGYNSEIFSWNEEIIIGDNSSMNDNCKIYGNVYIGSNCLFASNIFISSGTHNFLSSPLLPIKIQDNLSTIVKPVIIEDDCWIGFGVVVMPGIYIGKGAIIGSNAVVTKDVFPYTINGGVPSREIGKRFDFSASFEKIDSNCQRHWPFFYKGINYAQFENVINVKEGIAIIDSISVFLLSKKNTSKLKIIGLCDISVSLKVFINKNECIELKINKGFFDIALNCIPQDIKYPEVFDRISEEIKEKFNVVVVETLPSKKNQSVGNVKLKIKSIGYDEN